MLLGHAWCICSLGDSLGEPFDSSLSAEAGERTRPSNQRTRYTVTHHSFPLGSGTYDGGSLGFVSGLQAGHIAERCSKWYFQDNSQVTSGHQNADSNRSLWAAIRGHFWRHRRVPGVSCEQGRTGCKRRRSSERLDPVSRAVFLCSCPLGVLTV